MGEGKFTLRADLHRPLAMGVRRPLPNGRHPARMFPRKQSMFRRNLLRDRSGASAIEFAMIAPLLIFMLVGIFELGTLALISSGLDNAVNNISRQIRTGQTPGPTSAASFENMVCTDMGGNVADCMN